MFSMAFNTPQDYDFGTGLVNVNANNRNGQPQEYYTFQATKCKNVFSKGKFEQEIEGKLVIEKKTPASNNGRATTTTAATNSRSSPRTAEQIVAEQNASFEYGTTEGSEQTRMLAEQDAGLFDEPKQPPTTQPAPPPAPPTSSGDIDYNAGLAGTDGTNAAPPVLYQAVLQNGRTATFYNQAQVDRAIANGATAVTSSPPQNMNREP
jgi:hypothetical protein